MEMRAALVHRFVLPVVVLLCSCTATDSAGTRAPAASDFMSRPPSERAGILRLAIARPGEHEQLERAIQEINAQRDQTPFALALEYVKLFAPDLAYEFYLWRATVSPPWIDYIVDLDGSPWVWNSATEVFEREMLRCDTFAEVVAAISRDPIPLRFDAFGWIDARSSSLGRFLDRTAEARILASWRDADDDLRGNFLAAANGVRLVYLQLAVLEVARGGDVCGPYGRALAFICTWAPALAERLGVDPTKLGSPTYNDSLAINRRRLPTSMEGWHWDTDVEKYVPRD